MKQSTKQFIRDARRRNFEAWLKRAKKTQVQS